MSDAAIELQNVNKRFGDNHAVRDLALTVPAGSICGFLGPNGAGKSTTIRMIMSIIYPDSGDLQVLGGSALSRKDQIGYLPEERGVYRKMRVGEYLRYMARLKGAEGGDIKRRCTEWLARVDLPDVEGKRCEELSKGMQQKVQIVAAIIHKPDLLILDEPFSGLDPVNTQLVNQLIRDMNEQGTTIIFSTHILHQAEQICDRIFLINKGVKLLDATIEDIRREFDPRTIIAEPLEVGASIGNINHVQHVAELDDTSGREAWELELDDDANPQDVMKELLASQPMRAVELRQVTLDDVFIRLVAEGQGAQAAAQAREELSHV